MGNVSVIVGLQWGDEGKGRVSHFVSDGCICIRSTGGNNAGHTVVANGKKFPLHLIPGSIVKPGNISIIAPGVVLNLEVLASEIEMLRKEGVSVTPENLIISPRAHVILSTHIAMDKMHEMRKANKVGTTLRGIGPCYSDKVNRIGIRMDDFCNCSEDELFSKVRQITTLGSMQAVELFNSGIDYADFSPKHVVLNSLLKYRDELTPFVRDEREILIPALQSEDSNIVVEGAQSFYLDLDHGDYPYVTSSNPTASGTVAAAGIGPTYVTDVFGVMKAYCSRVGEGPFPTELSDFKGELIRAFGHEYGTTTGRPRRCGWLDLVRLKNAAVMNGVTAFCLNHLDTIGKVGKELGGISVCTAYNYSPRSGEQKAIEYVPVDGQNCTPIYKTFDGGWDTTGCEKYEDLPKKAREFIEFIEEYTGIPVKIIGIGADEKDTIIR